MKMNSESKPKPIQIRLPQDLEDSLRYVAYRTRSTLNSVVIESLKEHLPAVTKMDLALSDSVTSLFVRSADEVRKEAHQRLGRYQEAVQRQLDLALQLASLLNAQVSHARSMQDGLLEGGVRPKVPGSQDGTTPDDTRTERGIAPEFFSYLAASNLLKSEVAARSCRKEMARQQYDAFGQWENVKELLQQLDQLG